MLKKFLAILMILCLAFCIVACTPPDAKGDGETTTGGTLNVVDPNETTAGNADPTGTTGAGDSGSSETTAPNIDVGDGSEDTRFDNVPLNPIW